MTLQRTPPASVTPARGPGSRGGRIPTAEIQRKIVHALSAGSYLSEACAYAGVPSEVVMGWLNKGRGDDPSKPPPPIFRKFYEAVTQAEANARVRALALWAEAMKKDWHASVAWLERRYPESWRPGVDPDMTPPATINAIINQFNIEGGGAPEQRGSTLRDLLRGDPSRLGEALQLLDRVVNDLDDTAEGEVRELP